MQGIKSLSLVVPAYKQERTITEDVRNLRNILERLHVNYEIIIVVDGMLDKTYEKIKNLRSKKIKVYTYKNNQGKGYAVKLGMSKATGDVGGYIDAGMDIDPNGISMLLSHMIWYDADVIVGSKLHPVSKVNYPFARRVMSWGYRTFTRILFGFSVRDTQAGIKLFKKKVYKDVFPRLIVKKFAFDVEMLALAYALGYKRIYEAPIKLNFRGAGSITSKTLWSIILLMLLDTIAIYYRVRIVKYYRKSNKKNWIKD